MRITEQEKQTFIQVLSGYIDEPAELRLFGSRASDNAKGGDIDLLIQVNSEEAADRLMYCKIDILTEIKMLIDDQKIDLLICTKETSDPFIQSVIPTSMLLHRWE